MDKLPLDRARWPFIALLASAGMLAAAHAFERFLALAPCPLCYSQRQAYWAAGALALIAVMINWRGAPARVMIGLCLMLGAVFAVGAGVAGYHTLVEWGVLPAPETCTVGAVDLGADIWAQLNRPMAVPSCAEPLWHFLGLSMAAWNTLISASLAAASVICALRAGPVNSDTANETASELAPQ